MKKLTHTTVSLLLACFALPYAGVGQAEQSGTAAPAAVKKAPPPSARIEDDLPAREAPKNPKAYSDRNNAITIPSEDGKYRVSLYSNHYPLPLGKIHSWTVHIETPDGKPLENAKIYIHGGMPAHRHGLPTKPRVKQYLGNGDYRIDGVKFSMAGRWEMRINIKETTRRDRAVYQIQM